MHYYFLIIIAALLSVSIPILTKLFVKGGKKQWTLIYLAAIIGVLLLFVYIRLLEERGAAVTYTIVKVMSIVLLTIICYFFLQESLTSKKVIGIIFGILSLIFLVG